jgi:hypothetical protein
MTPKQAAKLWELLCSKDEAGSFRASVQILRELDHFPWVRTYWTERESEMKEIEEFLFDWYTNFKAYAVTAPREEVKTKKKASKEEQLSLGLISLEPDV